MSKSIIFLKNLSTTLLLKIISIILIYALTIILSKYYTSDQAAFFFTVLNFILVFSFITMAGFESQAFMHGNIKNKEEKNEKQNIYLFILRLVIQLLISMSLLMIFIKTSNKEMNITTIIIISISIFLYSLSYINSEFMRSNNLPNQQIINSGIIFYAFIVITILIPWNSIYPTINLVGFILLASTASCLFSFFIIRKKNINHYSGTLKIALSKNKEQFAFFIYSTTSLIIPQIPILLIGTIDNSKEIVDFNVLIRVATLYGIPLVILTSRFFPKLKDAMSKNELHKALNIYLTILITSSILTLIAFISTYIILSNDNISSFLAIEWNNNFKIIFLMHLLSAIAGPNIITLMFCIDKKQALSSTGAALIPIIYFLLFDIKINSENLAYLMLSMAIITNITATLYIYLYFKKQDKLKISSY